MEHIQEWSGHHPRIKWTAVWAGLVVGMSSQLVLTLLGLAIGAWSIDLKDAQPGGGIPLGAGLWTGLSLLLSAFIGGSITARLSGVSRRRPTGPQQRQRRCLRREHARTNRTTPRRNFDHS